MEYLISTWRRLNEARHNILAIAFLIVLSVSPCLAQTASKGGPRDVAQQNMFDISLNIKNEDIIDNLYLDDSTPQSELRLQRLLKLYPEEDFHLGDQGMMVSVSYTKCDSLLLKTGSKENLIMFSFWHDTERKLPCPFYEYIDKFNRNGDNVTSDEPAGDENIVKEELRHMQLTNKLTRKRSGTTPFHLFVPSHIYNLADLDNKKMERQENDTIYMFAELYSATGKRLFTSGSYVYWVRTPPDKPTGCPHNEEDTTDVVLERTKIDDGLYLVKFDRKRVCRQCGRKILENGIERTEAVEEKKEKSTHEHVWQYLDDEIDYNSLKKEPSSNKCYIRQSYVFNMRKQCLICGEEQRTKNFEDVTILPNSDAPINSECCPSARYVEEVEEKPAVIVGDRMKMDKEITTFYYCPDTNKKQLVGKRTETEWSEPCRHNFELIGTDDLGLGEISRYYHKAEFIDHYRCNKCGMLKDELRAKLCSHQYKQKRICSKAYPWTVYFKGVPLNMKLVRFEQDSTAVYVAETETTQQLWKAVCPDNDHGWDGKSTFPATEVTAEEIAAFMSRLNSLAAQQGIPVRFRLPKGNEWSFTYIQGNDLEGWTRDYGGCIHPVKDLAANKIGLFDMKGNVAELCSDTASIGEEGYKTLQFAVAGLSFDDSAVSFSPAAYRWMDMTEGKANVGFRIFADPIDGDEGKLQETSEMRVGEATYKIGDVWLVRLAYQCQVCGHMSYGMKHHHYARALAGKKPFGCE